MNVTMMKIATRAGIHGDREEGAGLDQGDNDGEGQTSYAFASITASQSDDEDEARKMAAAPKKSSSGEDKGRRRSSRTLGRKKNSLFREEEESSGGGGGTARSRNHSSSSDDVRDNEDGDVKEKAGGGLNGLLGGLRGFSGKGLGRENSSKSLIVKGNSNANATNKDLSKAPPRRGLGPKSLSFASRKRTPKGEENHIGEININKSKPLKDPHVGEITIIKTPAEPKKIVRNHSGEIKKPKRPGARRTKSLQTTPDCLKNHIGEIKITKRPPPATPATATSSTEGEKAAESSDEVQENKETSLSSPAAIGDQTVRESISIPLENIAEDGNSSQEDDDDEQVAPIRPKTRAQAKAAAAAAAADGKAEESAVTGEETTLRKAADGGQSSPLNPAGKKSRSDHGSSSKIESSTKSGKSLHRASSAGAADSSSALVPAEEEAQAAAGMTVADFLSQGEDKVPHVRRSSSETFPDVLVHFFLDQDHPVVWVIPENVVQENEEEQQEQQQDAESSLEKYLELNIVFDDQVASSHQFKSTKFSITGALRGTPVAAS